MNTNTELIDIIFYLLDIVKSSKICPLWSLLKFCVKTGQSKALIFCNIQLIRQSYKLWEHISKVCGWTIIKQLRSTIISNFSILLKINSLRLRSFANCLITRHLIRHLYLVITILSSVLLSVLFDILLSVLW